MPDIVNSGPGNCTANVPNTFSCVPVCNSGWKGSLSAVCNAQSWQLSGQCVSANTGGGLSTGAIIGIVIAAVFASVVVIGAGLWYCMEKKNAFEVV